MEDSGFSIDKIFQLLLSFDHTKLTLANIREFINKDRNTSCIIGFLVLYLAIGWGNDFLCNLIGFSWPAYQSIKAIETKCNKDDTKWLMYWVVYALFGLLEFFGDHLLFWIPFYTLSKCVFLLWLMVPGQNGGTFLIYNRIIKPFFLKHENKIDQTIKDAKDAFGKVVKDNLGEKAE